jgi:hypothetical protein
LELLGMGHSRKIVWLLPHSFLLAPAITTTFTGHRVMILQII